MVRVAFCPTYMWLLRLSRLTAVKKSFPFQWKREVATTFCALQTWYQAPRVEHKGAASSVQQRSPLLREFLVRMRHQYRPTFQSTPLVTPATKQDDCRVTRETQLVLHMARASSVVRNARKNNSEEGKVDDHGMFVQSENLSILMSHQEKQRTKCDEFVSECHLRQRTKQNSGSIEMELNISGEDEGVKKKKKKIPVTKNRWISTRSWKFKQHWPFNCLFMFNIETRWQHVRFVIN